MMRPESPAVALGALETAQRRFHGLAERQSAADVQHRREAHLDVAHAVAPGVDRQLVRDPLERLGRLQHGERDVELREVVLEAPRVVDAHELAQRVGVVARDRLLVLARQLEQRLGTDGAVEVAVQLGLRQAAEQLRRDWKARRHDVVRRAGAGRHDAEDGTRAHHGGRIQRKPAAVGDDATAFTHPGGLARIERPNGFERGGT